MLRTKSFQIVIPLVLTAGIIFSSHFSIVQAALPLDKTTVAYIGPVSEGDFQAKVKPLFLEKSRSCRTCEITNWTPYKATGEVDKEALLEKIRNLPPQTNIVFFDFNMKATDLNRSLIEVLNQKAEEGLIIVGTAGVPPATESSGPLSRTVLGQVNKAIIIGELAERDRLMPSGFYGPEMLTAVRPPKDMMGQGMGPLIFAAALSEARSKNVSRDWVSYLREKKMKTRKIWLEMNDVF
jgi:hypothetical protein